MNNNNKPLQINNFAIRRAKQENKEKKTFWSRKSTANVKSTRGRMKRIKERKQMGMRMREAFGCLKSEIL